MRNFIGLSLFVIVLAVSTPAMAHHVLGRPQYALSEDSSTPPAITVETQIGSYFVTMMVFPAFPNVGEWGRVSLYATHLDTKEPFTGTVTFSVGDDGWFSGPVEEIGIQNVNDNLFRQPIQFQQDGDYVIIAQFEAGGEPYRIDMPLRVGTPPSLIPVAMATGLLVLILGGVAGIRRRRRKGKSAPDPK